MILQQGGFFLHEVGKVSAFGESQADFDELARASVSFWTKRALERGAFEEYYPWEKGYPPLAFSTLSAARLIGALEISNPDTEKALRIASRQLLSRFERRAGNQQAAGLAALAHIRNIRPDFTVTGSFRTISGKTLKLQDSEGWFTEYDGPDTGYLSVTMDCLWDLFDITGDQEYMKACLEAFKFLSRIVIFLQSSPGMHNARNTDYIVPYGICRFLTYDDPAVRKVAGDVVRILFGKVHDPSHFLHAVDDRYWCHYIGHSVARAEAFLESKGIEPVTEAVREDGEDLPVFLNAGYIARRRPAGKVFVSCRKGGLISVMTEEGHFSDFGWIVRDGANLFVSHWWDNRWSFDSGEDSISVSGRLVPCREKESTPVRHMLLRLASSLFGYRIIGWLKNRLIFATRSSRYIFERKILFTRDTIEIHDTITGLKGTEAIAEAPRFSQRHVASADSYHPDDFHPVVLIRTESETSLHDGKFSSYKKLRNC